MTINQPKPGTQVRVTRTELPAPALDDPGKIIIQVQYQVGELPPRFLHIAKKDWTAAKEAELIKADLAKRMATPGEVITI